MRLLATVLIFVACAVLAACGSQDKTATTPATTPSGPLYTLNSAEGRLEGAGLELQRDGSQSAAIVDTVDPKPRVAQRYASQSGTEFDLLVYATSALAKQALASAARTDVVRSGGAYTRAANLVVVTPDGPRDNDLAAVIFRVFNTLSGRTSDADLSGRTTATELARLGDRAAGRAVTVVGPVGQLLPSGGPARAFFLGGSRPGERLLVVPRKGAVIPLDLGGSALKTGSGRLRVSGVIRPIADAGQYVASGDSSFLQIRSGDIVLIAQTVEPAT